MAFKQKSVVNARLDRMSKTQLVKTVKTLQKRETKLLNRIAELENVVEAHSHLVPEKRETKLLNRIAELENVVEAHSHLVPAVSRSPFPWET